MSTTTPTPISFENDLAYDLAVYDSFDDTDSDQDENYFGDLTLLGKVAAKSTAQITPIHTTSTFIVENAAANKPVKRCIKMSSQKNVTSFTIAQPDEDAMTTTFSFVSFILNNPNDPLAKEFKTIQQGDPDALLSSINDFFSRHDQYKACNFQDYMMAITYVAQHPETIAQPPQQATYSLSKLVTLMGGQWPDGMADISVSHFKCTNKNSQLDFSMQVDVSQLPYGSQQISNNVGSLLGPQKALTVDVSFNYAISLGIFATRLTIALDDLKVPTGNGDSFAITKPTITLDINPLFKFVVFTVKGYIPFNMFGAKFNAEVSLVVDNEEAEIGVDITGDHASLPAPPIAKGVHFDEFGVGMGLFFEPPGYALGLQGKFHIGVPAGDNEVELNDDTFALVCKIDGEVPEPVFISFYVPQMDINKVVELFTNANPNLNVPVSFSDLSFRWSEKFMDAYALPDGTLSEGGYGFSATVKVFAFEFYGIVEVDLNNGLTADVEVSPLNWNNVFRLSGDGKGVTVKVDQHGNPIRNNEIRDKKVLQDALAKATDKQVVAPGGPVLQINTLKSPILHLNGKVSLFELVNYGIEADINHDGIQFQLDFGGILTEQMTCQLSDFHNFYGSFKFGINREIPLPTVAGVKFASIRVEAMASAHISIQTSLSDVILKIGGSFDFEGRTRMFGDFSADIHIRRMMDVIEAVITNIEQYARQIFIDFLDDVELLASKAKAGLIAFGDSVANVLKNVYSKTAAEVTSIMKGAGYLADEVVAGLKDAFKAEATDVAALMKAAGFAADQISAGIQKAWNCGLNDVTYALHYAGYGAQEVAGAVKSAFNTAKQDITNSLKWLGYAAGDVAGALKNLYGAAASEVASLLKNAGYTADEVAASIKNTWNYGVNDVESAMKAAGYGAEEVINALKNIFSITDIASALKNVYGLSVNDINSFLQSAGYAADQVKQAFESLGGDFASFATQTWDKIKNPDTWNPSKW